MTILSLLSICTGLSMDSDIPRTDLSDQEAYENAIKVSALYEPRQIHGEGDFISTAPPKWATEFIYRPAIPGRFEGYARMTEIYFNAADSFDAVQELAYHREPANIEMDRFYKEAEFEKITGYKRGAYGKSTPEKLMPNIAVYTYTPIKSDDDDDEWDDFEEMENIHVISLIGNGFDTPQQPDFQYFLDGGKNKQPSPEKEAELKERIEMMYRFAFECAKRHRLKKIQWGGVGDGNFAVCSNEGVNLQALITKLNNAAKDTLKKEFPDIEVLEGWKGKTYFNVPDDFFKGLEPDFEDTLYINAWDPWSLVGNGHKGDDSVDGKYGRISAMAWLSWYKTNPYLNENKFVPVQAPERSDEDTRLTAPEKSDEDTPLTTPTNSPARSAATATAGAILLLAITMLYL